jgi:uncharacterized protein YueI
MNLCPEAKTFSIIVKYYFQQQIPKLRVYLQLTKHIHKPVLIVITLQFTTMSSFWINVRIIMECRIILQVLGTVRIVWQV